jgi:hypothetical protein
MHTQRPTFVLQVQALHGVDHIRALRDWSKIGLRRFGIRCTSTQPKHGEESAMVNMDMRQFASSWVKAEDVKDGPILTTILAVLMNDKLGRPMLELATGQQFTLFPNHVDILIRAWGTDPSEWPGYEVELSHDIYTVKNKDGSKEEKEGVKIRAVSPRKPPKDGNGGGGSGIALPKTREELRRERDDDMADSIPF